MPPYFNISLQFQRKYLHPDFMADFDAHLDRSGLRFKAGYWHSEGNTQEEIALWNQKKLETDFKLGFTEHYSHGYKQALYSFKDYDHVRSIWMNQYPERDAFSIELIIPEREVLIREDSGIFCPERVAELLELAKKLWQFPGIKTVQTGLESHDESTSLSALQAGVPPNTLPFAIVERDCSQYYSGIRVTELIEGRPGVLLLAESCLAGPIE